MHPDDEATGPVFGDDGHLAESAAHAFVDGALSDADGARVVLHLAECAALCGGGVRGAWPCGGGVRDRAAAR